MSKSLVSTIPPPRQMGWECKDNTIFRNAEPGVCRVDA
jgi:hypothetical protein